MTSFARSDGLNKMNIPDHLFVTERRQRMHALESQVGIATCLTASEEAVRSLTYLRLPSRKAG